MADTPDTPQPTKAAAPRRRAPRKTAAAKPAGTKGTSKAPAKAPAAASKPKRTRAAAPPIISDARIAIDQARSGWN